ncbi:SDR family NAD(P)-dependent oxidoreductase [Okeania sp. SIO2B3]|uniref:SDR family NAD(P)-dependent oxidoreductase n=1 Tax=Okeania sp. SIO2B3 TaxID=2607784 RepID=UPI0013C25B36|nr:SDR family NAD(P)-dependent oxidoreductase [Okeania sp. SIO2B3]NET44335.1 SDR family NAD(P)-dependent oxidoreductase [Okeania sp. SIO2B3]
MNNLVEFLQEIYKQGWELWSEKGQLCYDAPNNDSMDSILAILKEYKTEILELLRDGQNQNSQSEIQDTERWPSVVFPLSAAQKQFCFLDQLDENSRQAYVDQVCLELEGVFDFQAMEQAIPKILERHEALRTRICSEGDFQEVLPESTIKIPLIDFSNVSPKDREAKVTEWMEGKIKKPFNLEQAPLWRVYILKLEEKLHWLVLRIHHIINDGLSIEIILQEIAAFYSAQCERKVCQLEKPMQFREYIEWQNQISQTEKMAASELHWLSKFSGSIPVLDLPSDRLRPPVMTYRGSRQTLKLDGELLEQIKKVSRQKGCTLFMSLLAIYNIFLSKLTGDTDIVVGTPARGRSFEGSENMIGYCNNVLPIRSNIEESLTFSEFLIKTRDILLGDYQNQDYPFPTLMTKLSLERDPSRPILVSTLFNLDRIRNRPNMYGLKTRLISVPKRFVPYDIVLDITETENELLFNLDYNVDLFDDTTIKRWLDHIKTLLEAIVSNPEQKVAQLSLLTVAEQQKLLEISQNSDNNNCISPLSLDNLPIYVLDSNKQLAPVGVDGEIYVAASGLPLNSSGLYEHFQLGLIRTTQQWGRRLPNGFLEWRGDIHKLVRVKGKQINLEEIEVALRSHPEVKDCYVLVREEQLVAYLEVSNALSTELILEQLKLQFPRNMQPDAYVQVSALPLTASGQIDEKSLASIEVIDSQLREKWEEKLRSHPEVEQAAVVLLPKTSKVRRPVHVLDLVPDAMKAGILSATVESEVEVSSPTENQAEFIPALSDGGKLIIGENQPQTLVEGLQKAAQQHSERGIVYINGDGKESIQSYGDLLKDAQIILAGLRKLGLKPQDKVIFQLQEIPDFISAFWGCLLGGFIPVPVSIVRSDGQGNNALSKLENIWYMLEKPLILTDSQLAPKIKEWFQKSNLENLELETLERLQECEPDRNIYNSRPEDLAILLLTSGSTGKPKAVMLKHCNLLSMSVGTIKMNQFSSQDVTLNWMPMDHVGALVFLSIMAVDLGCQQIHVPTELILQNPLKWLDLIDNYQATISWAPNFAFTLIGDRIQEVKKRNWNLSSMRFLVNAGEAIVTKTARNFLKLLSPHGLSSKAIHPAFGMCETCSGITWSNSFSLEASSDEDKFVELGKPISGACLRIVDVNQQVVAEGVVGFLQVRGASVTSGYYQNAVATQEAFTEDGWFNTGDLGFLKAGHLTITGRQKDVIIINGLNYYSHEIEAVVEELSGIEVSYTAACAIRDAETNTDKLAIFFSTKKTDDNELKELLKEMRSTVVKSIGINPDYLIPVDQEIIPKTAIGKIQRTQLKQSFEAGEFRSSQKQVDLLLENSNTIPDWFYQQVWGRKEALISQYVSQGLTLVFIDGLGLGNWLCKKSHKTNQPYIQIETGSEFKQINENSYSIVAGEQESYQELFKLIATRKTPISRIIYLVQYKEYSAEIANIESLEDSYSQEIYSLLSLVQELEKNQGSQHEVQLLCVSSYSQSVLPTDKIDCEKSTVLGLLKTIPQEMPWLSCRHIDLPIEEVEINGNYLWQELFDVSPVAEVAYREGKRLVSGIEAVNFASAEQKQLPFKEGGIYLISGGLGGIGREIAKYLLEHYQAKLILVGRSSLVAKNDLVTSEKNQAYQQLQQLGTVTYQAVDICNLSELQQVVTDALSKWGGKLDGVIHLAGVLEDKLLLTETKETLAKVLRPKVLGTWVLHQLLKEHNSDGLFIHFASVNGFFGGIGVGAYAAANSFQTAFCDRQRIHSNIQSYCLAWSMWDETGMSQGYQMKEQSRAKGYYEISPLQGIYSLLAVLGHGKNNLIVGLDDSKPLMKKYSGKCESRQQFTGYFTAKKTGELAKVKLPEWQVSDRFGQPTHCQWVQLEQMPQTETGEIDREQLVGGRSSGDRRQTQPRNDTESKLVGIFQEVLGLSSVGIHDNFFELRGDSLKMIQVVSRVQETLKVKLPVGKLFEKPTVAELSIEIEANSKNQLSLAKQLQTASNNQEKWEEIEL